MQSENNPGGATKPISDNPEVSLRSYKKLGAHYRRYLFARDLCVGQKVLDFGCGYGFGALILGDTVSEYVGVDLDKDAIAWANDHLLVDTGRNPGKVRFLTPVDFGQSYPDAYFDTIVCFEVIEHLDNPLGILNLLMQKVAPGGRILISTPNGAMSRGRPEFYSSEFHKHEFSASELVRSLKTICDRVVLLREDRVDGLNKIWRRSYAQRYIARKHARQSIADLFVFWVQAFISAHFNGPNFWRISNLSEMDYESPDFSNILAILSK